MTFLIFNIFSKLLKIWKDEIMLYKNYWEYFLFRATDAGTAEANVRLR